MKKLIAFLPLCLCLHVYGQTPTPLTCTYSGKVYKVGEKIEVSKGNIIECKDVSVYSKKGDKPVIIRADWVQIKTAPKGGGGKGSSVGG